MRYFNLFYLTVFLSLLFPQEVSDKSLAKMVEIVTKDGNIFLGNIIEQDDKHYKLKTKDGLIINVKMVDINNGSFWASFKAIAGSMANDSVKKEVDSINARVANWVYELPAHKYRYMSRKHSDVLKDPKIKKKK